MTDVSNAIRDEMVTLLPSLRAFARSLVTDHARADDLVQETVLKAWSNIDKFKTGTNLRAWLFTILRNTFYSDYRKKKREVEDIDNEHALRMVTPAAQIAHLDMQDFQAALSQIKPEQREALVLIGASGLSYEEAAEICDCAVGTVKSRVNRARAAIADILKLAEGEDMASGASHELEQIGNEAQTVS